jgi:hypothetical protein
MVYDTPTFVVNHLRQSSLYNPTWNTQKHLIFFRQYRIKKTIKSPVKNTRGFFLFCLSNINISDDKVYNFVVNIVDLNEFISYCYKYNQIFQVYFWIFRLTNQRAPPYLLLRRYCRKKIWCFCVFQVGLYNELWRR